MQIEINPNNDSAQGFDLFGDIFEAEAKLDSEQKSLPHPESSAKIKVEENIENSPIQGMRIHTGPSIYIFPSYDELSFLSQLTQERVRYLFGKL